MNLDDETSQPTDVDAGRSKYRPAVLNKKKKRITSMKLQGIKKEGKYIL
jgi:hypothetical protein